jgi:hypothetical protein
VSRIVRSQARKGLGSLGHLFKRNERACDHLIEYLLDGLPKIFLIDFIFFLQVSGLSSSQGLGHWLV